MAVVKLSGVSFENKSLSVLESENEVIKSFLEQLLKQFQDKIGIWTHLIKTKAKFCEEYHFDNDFVSRLNEKYMKSFVGKSFFEVGYYISFIIKTSDIEEGIEKIEDIVSQSVSVLNTFGASAVSIEQDGLIMRNYPLEFLQVLLSGNQSEVIPLYRRKAKEVICNTDVHFGYDMFEYRTNNSNESRFGVAFDLDAYPDESYYGMWDFLLNQPQELVLTQSFIGKSPLAFARSTKQKRNELRSSSSFTNEDLETIDIAEAGVANGKLYFGDYHCSLVVISDSKHTILEEAGEVKNNFLIRGTSFKKSTLNNVNAFLSVMPASKERALSQPKTTTNLSHTFSLHNYPSGKKKGNPIGDGSAVVPLKTVGDSLYYFNSHASEIGKDVTGEKYAGHTMCLGASGTGKTTLEGFLTAYYTRWNPQLFCIDYNRSTELFIRAYGGQYFAFKEGTDTGLNPFQLEDTPSLRAFLHRLVCRLGADKTGEVSPLDDKLAKTAIDTVFRLRHADRRLSNLLQSIPEGDFKMRLSKWTHAGKGTLAWALDSPVNRFNPAAMDRIGFDTTVLLDTTSNKSGHPACEPVLAVLFYLKSLMQKEGRLMMSIVEEFWMPANFPLTQSIMKNILKAGRLKNEFMFLSSQSPEDAINCEIFPAIVQQTATKIYLPNPDAEYPSYEKCNVSKGEFEQLKKLGKQSRTFLIKQSNDSIFAKLDLGGFDEFLPIISGDDHVISLCESVRQEVGDNPDRWIPELIYRLNSKEAV
nr:conjugal transfer protein TraE [Thaumasiovibrio subtropicus]